MQLSSDMLNYDDNKKPITFHKCSEIEAVADTLPFDSLGSDMQEIQAARRDAECEVIRKIRQKQID